MAPQKTASQLRNAFLSFFEGHGHRRVPSASLVPENDATLLFTNSGMVPFKDVFTGREVREYTRATTTQKCLRAGGKHNDLDSVGFTPRHHTFFEMLGNFSFGDYFKEEAIAWAWEFLTAVLQLPKEKLAVTVFQGAEGIAADDEAASLWESVGVPRSRVYALGFEDNFWSMGDTGPCGPSSEVHWYLPQGPGKNDGGPGVSPHWLEIWNLVFMQFQRSAPFGPLLPLPRPSIDTGAGLERLAAVLQGKTSNYDTDLFAPILAALEAVSGRAYAGSFCDERDAAMRIIADHSRATAFLVADGVQPSNEGRGYVLRRIMRRAIRHGGHTLNLDAVFFSKCVDAVIQRLGTEFPELLERREFIYEVSRHEEEAFRRTLHSGRSRLVRELKRLEGEKTPRLSGEVVWDMHQTYGFPWDLTEVMAKERGFSIDKCRFEVLLEEERRRHDGALGTVAGTGDAYMRLASAFGGTTFLGHEGDGVRGRGTVLELLRAGVLLAQATQGEEVEVILDKSPFYGEAGGQLGDTGRMEGEALRLEVRDTKKPAGDVLVHTVRVTQGTLRVGAVLQLQVDVKRRSQIRANHSATHLLHKALKVVLGASVNQKGSVVGPEALRFDFSHFRPVAQEDIESIENLVNEWIRDNHSTQTRIMGLAEAKASGAVALFGEKYAKAVRVVTVHPQSTELCGGTHVHSTGEVGLFRIVQESAVASGVRRIVALTAQAALQHGQALERHLQHAAAFLKVAPAEVPQRIQGMHRQLRDIEGAHEALRVARALGQGETNESQCEIHGIKILTRQVGQADAPMLRKLADSYRDRLVSGVIALGGVTAEGKALLVVAATKDVAARGFHAGEVVRSMAQPLNGTGGGRDLMAQAGGDNPSGIPQSFEVLLKRVRQWQEGDTQSASAATRRGTS